MKLVEMNTPWTFARLALFVVYFWFGMLKVFAVSPASPLVAALLDQTMPSIPISWFEPAFGLCEVAIGILFLFPQLTRWAVIAAFSHLLLTILPLFLLPGMAWSGLMTPTLEGQYIIKNVLIVAILVLLSHESSAPDYVSKKSRNT